MVNTKAMVQRRVQSMTHASYFNFWRHIRLSHESFGQTFVTRAEHEADHRERGDELDHYHIKRSR